MTMVTSMLDLPTELLHQVLLYLPIPVLLAFSGTSRANRALAQDALHTLNLAVFPRRTHCELAFINDEHQNGVRSKGEVAIITTEKTTHQDRQQLDQAREERISDQNARATEILKKESFRKLKSLTLQLYDLTSPELTNVIATQLTQLRELEFKFQHAHIHDNTLPGIFWYEPSRGTPAWNSLAGLGEQNARNLRLRGLRSIKVERGSLTSTQLRKWIEANPLLQRLYLNNVRGVDKAFVEWLAKYCARAECRIEEISLENCSELLMVKEQDFKWMAELAQSTTLKTINLFRSRNVRHDVMSRLIERDEFQEWGLNQIENVIPPKGPAYHFGISEAQEDRQTSRVVINAKTGISLCQIDKIEVDPDYMVPCVAVAA